MATAWKDLYHRASRRHGIVTLGLLDDLEIARATFYDHAATYGFEQRHRSVWTLPEVEWTFSAQAAAGLAAVGPPALVTGEAGLHLLGAARARPRDVTALVAPNRSARGHRRVIVRRCKRFFEISSTTVDGVAVACFEQCCVDASRSLGIDALARRMAAGCRLRLTDMNVLEAYTEPLGRFHGGLRWDAAISALRGELVHSNPEQVARDALRPLALGFHPEPFTVLDEEGRPMGEIDIAIPALRHGTEIDGPDHELPAQQLADERRDQALRDLTWRIDRYPWDEVTAHPARFAAKVARAVRTRAKELDMTWPPVR